MIGAFSVGSFQTSYIKGQRLSITFYLFSSVGTSTPEIDRYWRLKEKGKSKERAGKKATDEAGSKPCKGINEVPRVVLGNHEVSWSRL